MRKLIACALGASLIAASTIGGAVPAQAAAHSRSYYVQNYCMTHPSAPDCVSWRHHGRNWDQSHYRRFYNNHQSVFPAFVAGIFGLAVGAAIANSANHGGSHHVARCEAQYRSYNPRTDMFLGYDGHHHRCML